MLRFPTAALLAAATLTTPALGVTVWDESIDGDLSGDAFAPTSLIFSPGVNSIFATTGDPGNRDGDSRDNFTFDIPAGFELTSVDLVSYTTPGGAFQSSLLQAGTGTAFDNGNPAAATGFIGQSTLQATAVGNNLAPAGSASFQPGSYSWSVGEFGVPEATYQLDFNLTAIVPPPQPGDGNPAVIIEDFADSVGDPDFGGFFEFGGGTAGDVETAGNGDPIRTQEVDSTPWDLTPAGETVFTQVITLEDDPATTGGGLNFPDTSQWTARMSAFDGIPQVANLLGTSGAEGWVGFYARTTADGIQTRLSIDDQDEGVANGFEFTTILDIVGDGEWQLLQWNLGDPSQIETGFGGDGILEGPGISLDSIWFFDTAGDPGLTSQVEFAYVFYDADSPVIDLSDIGLEGDLDNDGDVDVDDIDLLAANVGIGTTPAEGDLDGDGDVDTDDLAVLLSGLGTVAGDANLDQMVDTSDLAILAANFETAVGSYGLADYNIDGTVNTSDLAILAANFGFDGTAPPLVAAAAVPEPATLALIGLGGVAALVRRRQA
ncbi:MAG: PEP-CTERM sorting domain-containing protein [Planctomycetota bacterium]